MKTSRTKEKLEFCRQTSDLHLTGIYWLNLGCYHFILRTTYVLVFLLHWSGGLLHPSGRFESFIWPDYYLWFYLKTGICLLLRISSCYPWLLLFLHLFQLLTEALQLTQLHLFCKNHRADQRGRKSRIAIFTHEPMRTSYRLIKADYLYSQHSVFHLEGYQESE